MSIANSWDPDGWSSLCQMEDFWVDEEEVWFLTWDHVSPYCYSGELFTCRRSPRGCEGGAVLTVVDLRLLLGDFDLGCCLLLPRGVGL